MIIRLTEADRKDLVNKSRRESPKRWVKKNQYTSKKSNCRGVDMNKLLTDDRLTIEVDIKGTDLYTCTISFGKFLSTLRDIIVSGDKESIIYTDIQRALLLSIDDSDNLKVDCTCPDWFYRYKYWSTQGGFNAGTPQNSNGKEIRNPNNDIGAVCKHLLSLLYNKRWLSKVATWLNDYMKSNAEIFADAMDLPIELFTKHKGAYYLGKASKKKDDKDKWVSKWRDTLNKDNEPEEEVEVSEEEVEEDV